MKCKLLAFPALLLALAGCGPQNNAGSSVATNRVSVPALPIIQDAVRALYPTFNGKDVPVLANHLCTLASGGMTQEQGNAELAKLGVNPAILSHKSNDALGLLVNGDSAGQATACAAYHAVSALRPLDPAQVMRPVAQKPEAVAKEGDAKKEERGAEQKPDAKVQPTVELDYTALGNVAALRIAEIRTNADIFAQIASQLGATPGLRESDYRSRAIALFGKLAPHYLDDLKRQVPPANTLYRLDHLSNDQLTFSADIGLRYDATAMDGAVLIRDGQLWFGRGVILGKEYYLPVTF